MDNNALFDIATRKLFYSERLALWTSQMISPYLSELDRELRFSFSGVRVKSLGMMSRADVNRLVKELHKTQKLTWDEYTKEWLLAIGAIVGAELFVSKHVYNIKYNVDVEKTKKEISEMPLPANGYTIENFMESLAISSINNTSNAIMKGWANNWALSQAQDVIVGSGENVQGTSSVHDRILNANKTISNTAVAFAVAAAAAIMCAKMFNKYIWCSILDHRTSNICISRAGNVYEYGKGNPIPPAHPNCRSYIVPYLGGDAVHPAWFAWLAAQPEKSQDEILGKRRAKMLRDGKITEKDLQGFRMTKPITPDQYMHSIDNILLH